jgi:hypothetical protein
LARLPARPHNGLVSELHHDRAAALGRIGGTLESLIEDLKTLRRQMHRMSLAERGAAAARYDSLHEKARTYRWYLEVQREALGLTRHDIIDQLYALPPREP